MLSPSPSADSLSLSLAYQGQRLAGRPRAWPRASVRREVRVRARAPPSARPRAPITSRDLRLRSLHLGYASASIELGVVYDPQGVVYDPQIAAPRMGPCTLRRARARRTAAVQGGT